MGDHILQFLFCTMSLLLENGDIFVCAGDAPGYYLRGCWLLYEKLSYAKSHITNDQTIIIKYYIRIGSQFKPVLKQH